MYANFHDSDILQSYLVLFMSRKNVPYINVIFFKIWLTKLWLFDLSKSTASRPTFGGKLFPFLFIFNL